MYNIFAVALNLHDHNTYDGVFHNQRERYTRFKHNLPYKADSYAHQEQLNTNDYELNNEFVKDYFKKQESSDGWSSVVLGFSMTVGGIRMCKDILPKEVLDYKPKELWDHYYKNGIYFIDHHQSHATYAYINSGFEESDIVAIDGIGYKFRCIFVDRNKKIIDLSKELPIGWLWNQMSKLAGFGSLGASKLMGLVGYGKFSQYYYDVFETIISGDIKEKKYKIHELINIEKYGRQDLAFTLQKFTNDKIKEHIYPLKTCDNLCLAGGVIYNGYLNEEFTKHYKNVYIPPAVGDEGQALGVYQHADYVLNKNKHKTETFAGIKHILNKPTGFIESLSLNSVAQEIANGKIVGWYQGKSESGNRALGNRCILADPRRKDIKQVINDTIKDREDFRPFAPAVLEEHYQEYFDTNSPSPYMSRICKVKSDKVPGITHVDNTARIQTVNKQFNEKFYNLINEFYKITGIPMLLNTSFNCHEPIVESPEDAIRTFKRTALDLLVMNNYLVRK
jgi:carbamoyltransferase